ncbi:MULTISPECIES: GlsB/YeaQ/YmgE family stress response membrane protein [Paracoccaceae]|uniref:GlsB/YeaQ/YmgE family stress response membrane protein n=1 Tax=Paracoccaceae TaxID=31989 RepID=UPI0018E8F87C|nr:MULTISPECIES: GlsB/YeaQ/YmgE family stress response membrane protein [Paracoccaceae]MBJ2151169.1 GlsB/YeaQ/YmgE family stress response membrane protein [Paracoccus sp. IB05]
MGIESILILLVIGAVAGWLAGQLVKGYGFGLVGNIVVGVVGAFIAGLILPRIGLTFGGNAILASIIHATIGAVILLLLIRLVRTA